MSRFFAPLALALLTACAPATEDVDDFDNSDGGSDGTGGSGDGTDGTADDGSDGASDGSDGASDGSDGGTDDPFDGLSGDPTGCDLEGQAWLLDLTDARFIAPAGVADLLLGQLEGQLAVGVHSHSGAGADAYIGMTDGYQDPCVTTSDLPDASWDDPVLDAGPGTITLDVAGFAMPLEEARLAFVVDGSCDSFSSGVLAAQLDARSLAPLMGDLLGTEDPGEICGLMAGFGVTCEACSDGEDYCIEVLADQIPGDTPSFTVERITSSDVSSNPDCF